MKTVTVYLAPEQAARIQSAIDGGGYASNSEIVREALRLWEEREDVRSLEIQNLKQEYAEGKASGDPQEVDPLEFLQELKAERSARA